MLWKINMYVFWKNYFTIPVDRIPSFKIWIWLAWLRWNVYNVINDYLAISIAEIDRNDGVATAAKSAMAKQSHLFGEGFLRPWLMVILDRAAYPTSYCVVDSIDWERFIDGMSIVAGNHCSLWYNRRFQLHLKLTSSEWKFITSHLNR